jgi:hypothetical protein
MRARWTTMAGLVLVAGYAALLVGVAVTTESTLRRDDPGAPGDAVDRFIDAWGRSRRATFVTIGTFERRSEVTGAVISSEDVVAQRPPRRVHHQLGGVDGRDDDRLLVCPAPPPGEEDEPEPCRVGSPGRRSYEESVVRELQGLASIVGSVDEGKGPLYAVTEPAAGCFALDLRRPDPRAPFGLAATFCFDRATGAPVRTEVRYEGGISELVVVEEIRTTVSDADLEP